MITLLYQSLPHLLQGVLMTLQISLVAITFGLVGGTMIGILNSDKVRNPYFGPILNGFVWTMRGTPLFVQVLIFYYALPEVIGVSLSPFAAGTAALGLNSTAYISEIVRGGINAIPNGQWEAAYVIGLNWTKTLKGIILPQMFRMTLPSLTNELSSLVKESSILMVIGVNELTKVSKDIVARELDPMTIYLAAAVFYLVLTSALSWLAAKTQFRGNL